MKADNLLVFRSQAVKLGDLGTAVKLEPLDVDGVEEKYLVKGFTKGYSTDMIMSAFENDFHISKNELFESD